MECSICYGTNNQDDFVECSVCIYKYHEECINMWSRIKFTHNNLKCPVCKNNIKINRMKYFKNYKSQIYKNIKLICNYIYNNLYGDIFESFMDLFKLILCTIAGILSMSMYIFYIYVITYFITYLIS